MRLARWRVLRYICEVAASLKLSDSIIKLAREMEADYDARVACPSDLLSTSTSRCPISWR